MHISVIMPVCNGENFLDKSLKALFEAKDEKTEIIVVDDASTDNSAEIAAKFADKVLRLEKQTGSGAARNFGVKHTTGEIIFFVDADVPVKKDSLKNLRRIFQTNPEYSAVFGSYDDEPGEKGFFSQYRNLLHHYFHQIGAQEAETFWSGCGAIKREVFIEVGGFNEILYPRPSIEDIELGYRLREKGYRILLDRNFQVKHLKKWTFINILQTDIFSRALPWSRLLLQNPHRKHTLNIDLTQKICAVSVWLMFLAFVTGFFSHKIGFLFALFILLIIIGLNRRLYLFFRQKKDVVFALQVVPMQILYYVSSSLVFAFCTLEFYFFPKRQTSE